MFSVWRTLASLFSGKRTIWRRSKKRSNEGYAAPTAADPTVFISAQGVPTEDFQIENGCLLSYLGCSADVVIPQGVTALGCGKNRCFQGLWKVSAFLSA